jgi:hypothetical protein
MIRNQHLTRRIRNAYTEACEAFREYTFDDWTYGFYFDHFAYDCRKPRWCRLRYVAALLNEIRKAAVCGFFGHDLVDCSTGGPDSGNMDHECRRCGRYWDVPLY